MTALRARPALPALSAPADLAAGFAAMKAAQALVDHYRALGDDRREADHDARALAIRDDLVAALVRRSGLDAHALRDVLA